jgi:2-dehydro-3-deoxygluconokinase
MKPLVCFGEIMARLQPPGHLRFRQVMPGTLELTFAGAEANAAVTIAALGGAARFVTALPRNDIAEACLANLRAARVDVAHVVSAEAGRMGLYFVEAGANQRAGNVLYDRDGSSFCLAGPETYDWPEILRGAGWLHTTGIAASVSRAAAEATIAAVQAARAAGVPVSFDVNHRRKLWRWDERFQPEELARRTLGKILPAVDLLVGNPADLAQAAGLEVPATSGEATIDPATLPQLARAVVKQYPQVRRVAISLREGLSATHHRWGAMLYCAAHDRCWFAPTEGEAYRPYDIPLVVDRLGTGDALAGALLFALATPELAEVSRAWPFAVAAACLAHSVHGDFNYITRAEVETLLHGSRGGGVAR